MIVLKNSAFSVLYKQLQLETFDVLPVRIRMSKLKISAFQPPGFDLELSFSSNEGGKQSTKYVGS